MFWLVVIISTIVVSLLAYAVYYVSKRKKTPVMKKEKELQDLKKEQEKLEEEAKKIGQENPFTNADDAVKFLNDVIRRSQK